MWTIEVLKTSVLPTLLLNSELYSSTPNLTPKLQRHRKPPLKIRQDKITQTQTLTLKLQCDGLCFDLTVFFVTFMEILKMHLIACITGDK